MSVISDPKLIQLITKKPDDTRMSSPKLNKYERTAILGMRLEQLANGAPSFLPQEQLDNMYDIKDILQEEFKQKLIPFIIKRTMPTGDKDEYWKLSELIY
jgi:DNA-directed RNA polymerase subunit K/omega